MQSIPVSNCHRLFLSVECNGKWVGQKKRGTLCSFIVAKNEDKFLKKTF
jgi:hypothetical protein